MKMFNNFLFIKKLKKIYIIKFILIITILNDFKKKRLNWSCSSQEKKHHRNLRKCQSLETE